jgi:hypothetical protein
MRGTRATIVCVAAFAATAMAMVDAAAQAAPRQGVSIAALAHQARVRTALDALVPPERAVSQMGVELGAPTFWRPMRVAARVLRATRADDLASLDAGVVVGGRFVALEAAYATRRSYSPTSGLAHARSASFARAGLRGRLALGATGFAMHLRGNAYLPTGDDVEGWDGESGLSFSPASWPVTATLGYRLERFRIFDVEQEVSSLTFGLGFTLLGR